MFGYWYGLCLTTECVGLHLIGENSEESDTLVSWWVIWDMFMFLHGEFMSKFIIFVLLNCWLVTGEEKQAVVVGKHEDA